MKKNFLRAAFCLTLVASASTIAVSCSKDDDTSIVDNGGIDPANFSGTIKSGSTVTLDATKTYSLNGKLLVENGATLIIPAGTKIVATQGSTYLIVDRGGKIFANGTADKPVVFEGVQNTPGYWGGIVILGNAPTNRSASGTSTSELGEMVYGGTNKTDNSGVLSYVVIRGSGFKYNPEKEFNGLSLFGVGSGTTIANIFVVDGADDGIEFFGGNVNASNLVVIGVGDDHIDWTEGWQGSATNIYAARKTAYANSTEPGNRGVEADTQDTDPNTTNGNGVSNPTIKNMTLVGNLKGSESQGMKVRAGSHGVFENVVIANYNVGMDFETTRTYDWFKTAPLKVNQVRFVNVVTNFKTKDAIADFTIANIGVDNTATGAGSGTALPAWAKGWTGLQNFDVADAGN